MVCMSAHDSSSAGHPDGGRGPTTALGRRRPLARWVDVRFFLGVVLIAASIAAVWAVVAMTRQTSPVYAATRTIVPGEKITPDDLSVVDVALGRVGETYLGSDEPLSGLVAGRTITAGELVPRDAVQPVAAARTTTVVVTSLAEVPSAVHPGTPVEVWVAPLKERGSYDTPRVLVPRAVVASVSHDDSMLGGGSASLELVIPRADVAQALAAIAAGSAVSIVPAGGAG